MQMRQRRKMRTRPRAHYFQFSIPCEPYTIWVEGHPWEMTSHRVYAGFTMQHATRADFLRNFRRVAEREGRVAQTVQGVLC